MKHKMPISYLLIVGQVCLIVDVLYIFANRLINKQFLFRVTETHLWNQVILAAILLYSLYHFIRIKKASITMRKAAGQQREIKSKRIEMLIFSLMVSLIFYCLFYTVPMRKYIPILAESLLYYGNTLLQLLLLIRLISSDDEVNKTFIQSKQKYAGAGAFTGLLIFYIYFVLTN